MAKTSVKAAQPLDDEYGLKRGRRKCIPTASHLPVPIPFGVRLNGGLRSSIKTTTAAAKSQSNSEPADSSSSDSKREDVSLLEVSDTVSHSQLVKCSSSTESKDVSVSHSQLVKCSTSTAADADASVKTAKARRKRGTTLGGARKKKDLHDLEEEKKREEKKKITVSE
jgi:hypothetical protein